jgi:hypothetical protein
MSRYWNRDADDLRRDLVIAEFHPDFRDEGSLLDRLRAVRRARGEIV